MSSRRFRRLELEKGPLDPQRVKDGDCDVCRRCGAEYRDGETRCAHCSGVLGGPGQDEFDAAFRARAAAASLGASAGSAEVGGAGAAAVDAASAGAGREPDASARSRADTPWLRPDRARDMGAGASPEVETVPATGNDEPARREIGFGTVLAAGTLTACLFALVSIPVRLMFAAATNDPVKGSSIFELVLVVALTLGVRRAFKRSLAAL